MSASARPPPPPRLMTPTTTVMAQAQAQSPYATNVARSLTIDEMRDLHRRALSEAEAKRTELRLVLASRYRELVGSSDEVLKMRERAEELDGLVRALPGLVEKLMRCAEGDGEGAGAPSGEVVEGEGAGEEESKSSIETDAGRIEQRRQDSIRAVRRDLSRLPRKVHRCLDVGDVYGSASSLIELFDLVSSMTDEYPLAEALASSDREKTKEGEMADAGGSAIVASADPLLASQTKMVCLHVQTLPNRAVKLARRYLLRAAGSRDDGARMSASALSALDLLDVRKRRRSPADRAARLLDLYYDSKAKVLHGLLGRLSSTEGTGDVTKAAEAILSKIVLILQHDVTLHPYQIFVLRRFPRSSPDDTKAIMTTLPPFDPDVLKAKASHFLAAHLPLIRTKVKSVLMAIAGTTASKLGQIRQSLYDKTDGVDCMAGLDANGVCTWDDAVNGVVDVRVVSHGAGFSVTPAAETGDNTSGGGVSSEKATGGAPSRRFSLWSALFSHTFSSLVHSLLTTSFHSVHARVVSTLRTSLANAPPLASILPHEAQRNTLRIATDLDASLRRVSDDAHELLVHAEEREESERRLRQSLYVQTCEIMGRLLCELRRMLLAAKGSDGGEDEEGATRELIVGRLCHLLKFRLASLPTLLDSNSSPAILSASASGGAGKAGMITLLELRSSFELADDDDDGIISFDEAMEAMESAFSGTPFHGAEMVRDTLLLSPSTSGGGGEGELSPSAATGTVSAAAAASTPRNVTLSELALLSARGLRHDATGPESALGTVQQSLDDIIQGCFSRWATVALFPSLQSFDAGLGQCVNIAATVSDEEWTRLRGLGDCENRDDIILREIDEAIETGEEEKQDIPSKVGQVSPHVVAYLLSVASVLNRSVCPSDSLPPVPSVEYARALGISPSGAGGCEAIPNMMSTIRGALLTDALVSISQLLEKEILASPVEDEDKGEDTLQTSKLSQCCTPALIQLLVDVSFIDRCFFERNRNGFVVHDRLDASEDDEAGEKNYVKKSKAVLEVTSNKITAQVQQGFAGDKSELDSVIRDKHHQVLEACGLFLSTLFGEDTAAASSAALSGAGASSLYGASFSASASTFGGGATGAPSLILNPLASSRRFILLPIQAERSLNELQLRGKYGKNNRDDTVSGGEAPSSGSAVSSGFGFFSSMLKKK